MSKHHTNRYYILLGNIISLIRSKRGWSRRKLASRMLPLLEDTPFADTISEAWLKRLENGEVVKIPREIINALCEALLCSPRERSEILLLADRNVLNDESENPDPVIRALNFAVLQLKLDGYEILSDLLQDRLLSELDDDELLEIVHVAFEVVLKHRKKRK